MCGFVGIIEKNDKPIIDSSYIKESLLDMHNRGPDDSGCIELIDFQNSVKGILGHRRLSILDLSQAGHQPMFILDNKITVVYNGEIYNFIEIKKELQELGYTFKSNCDTEVILWAYKHFGEAFITKCNGMFSIALWDGLNQKLVLYRDRVGKKPLYYGFQNKRFYCASVLSAIAKIPCFEKEINGKALQLYTWLGYVPCPYSMFEGIKKLEPGHKAVLDFNQWDIKISKYWDIADYTPDYTKKVNEEAYYEELECLLTDAVKKRLISDVPLGAFLSGGIDSSLVVALMRKIHNGNIKTFSIGFDVDKYNEAPYAKEIAEHLETEHYELILGYNDIKNIMFKTAEAFDEPFADSSCLSTMLLSKMTREHVTVSLSGDGGDELFYGDYHHYRRSESWRKITLIPYILRKIIAKKIKYKNSIRYSKINDIILSKTFVDFQYNLQAIWNISKYPNLMESDFEFAKNVLLAYNLYEKLPSNLSARYLSASLDFCSLLPDDFLVKVDRSTMFSSLEARVPLLDYKVVEFAKKTPFDILFKNNINKYALKTILTKYVPDNLWNRPKKGFEVPLAVWFRSDLYDFVYENILYAPELKDYYDINSIKKIIVDHKNEKNNNYRLIWALLNFSLWHKNYFN